MSRSLRMAFLIAIVTLAQLLTTGVARAQSGTVIASDSFNRPNESPFAVSGNWGRTVAGNYDGFSTLVNNRVVSASNEGIYYWRGAGTFDPGRQFARQRVVQKDGEAGLTLLAGPDQAIMVAWGPPGVGDTVYIYWYENGLDRGQLATGPSTLANGDIIEAVLEGGVIYAKVNGVTVKSVANTTTLTSGSPGFVTFRNLSLPDLAIVDDWEAGTPSAYTIGGIVTENGTGLGGVLVTASGGFAGSATTDVSGVYSITGVPSGTMSVVLTPTLPGHTMSPLARTIPGPLTGNASNENFTSTPNAGASLTTYAVNGTVTRSPDQPTYAYGASVTLTPTAEAGYDFWNWSGDVPAGHATDNPLSVVMDRDRTITANFTAPDVVVSDAYNRADEAPLSVAGNWRQAVGGGRVDLTNNHVVGVSGEAVYYWQGGGTFSATGQFARLRVVDASGQVGLVLLGATAQALVAAWKDGTLYIYWYANGSYQGELAREASTIHNGDVIEALLEGGIVYARINGAVVKTVANTTTLTSGRPGFETYLSGAGFDDWEAGTPQSYSISGTITENASGLSGVQVTAGNGFNGVATTNANGVYTIAGVPFNATSIVLTPELAGHTFGPPTRTVAGPVTGNVPAMDFTATPNTISTLTVQATHGSVTKDPDQPTYAYGASVTLTPYPAGGYEFASWSGDVPVGHETDNPLAVTMTQNRTITANFVAPGIVAADYFDRADESPLLLGGNWAQPFARGFDVLTNNRVESASGEALYYWQGAGLFDNARQFARARVVQAGGQVGLVLLGAPDQGLVVSWGNGRLYIYSYRDGIHQGELANEPATLNDGDEIEAVLDQGMIHAKRNGVIVKSVAYASSLSSGRPGFETYLTGAVLDDWQAGIPAATCAGAPDGSPCTDGNTCTQSDSCQAGVCVGSNPVVCAAAGPCHAEGVCDPLTGACSNPVAADGTSCNDNNACTQSDSCQAGVCVGANPVVCAATDQCHAAGVCNSLTGVCSNPIAANGTSCNDGNACTTGDSCQAGACVGPNPVVCAATDRCHEAGVCNPQTGACSNPVAANGKSCNDDNACTQSDSCQAGVCVGANPVVCTAGDSCHTAGVCDPQTGACSTPAAPNGTSCDDGNLCTQTDVCVAGACVGWDPVVCTASDQCHTVGVCNPLLGLCTNPEAADGTSCNDGSACTTGDSCQGGSCLGAAVPPPADVQGVALDRGNSTEMTWTGLNGAVYDVASSTLSDLRVHGAATAACLSNDLASAGFVDVRPDPPSDDGYYYLVRGQNVCGAGSFGKGTAGLERIPVAPCP